MACEMKKIVYDSKENGASKLAKAVYKNYLVKKNKSWLVIWYNTGEHWAAFPAASRTHVDLQGEKPWIQAERNQ